MFKYCHDYVMYKMFPGRVMFALLEVFICFKYIVLSFMLVGVSVHVHLRMN